MLMKAHQALRSGQRPGANPGFRSAPAVRPLLGPYTGRLTTTLAEAVRLLMIKADRTFVI